MTGTAVTEAGEFWDIYKLDVVEIPTNKPVIRDDKEDLVYKTKREKYNAVIEEVTRLSQSGRPVLIGTTSVEISELLGKMLGIRKVPHNILNAKNRGIAIIFITHNVSHALTIGDKYAILKNGKLDSYFDREKVDEKKLLNLMSGGNELQKLKLNN